MMRCAVLLLMCAALAACGADGKPVQPSLGVGIGVSDSGVSAGANVGLSSGPFTLNLGIF